MDNDHNLEKLFHVWKGGYCIEVGGSSISPGLVVLRTVGNDNEDFFGRIDISMEPAFARFLGKALIEIADHEAGK